MMTSGRTVRTSLLLAICAGVLLAPAANASSYTLMAAPQATELWGGPAAKGTGAAGSSYDSSITISSTLASATGTVEFWAGGSVRATAPFTIGARGVALIPAPAALDGAGAFFYHVTATSAVTAYSETWNVTPAGRFGLSVPAFTTADFLNPGDEASAGGVEDSTDANRTRTNVGVLCAPGSAQECKVQVTAYTGSTMLGNGTLTSAPGAAAQSALGALVPGASGQSAVVLRLQMLQGQGAPYVIRNQNSTSDGTLIPLAIARSAFSTAPTVDSFTVTPDKGCTPLSVTLAWATTNAVRVTVSGATGDLPPSGTVTVSLLTSTDLVLTAYSATGATASVPRHVTVNAPPSKPVPAPAIAQVPMGGNVTGIIPAAPAGTVTAAFVQQQSTGSTFTLTGNSWSYTGGSTPGTDIVRLTAQGDCGPVTADFTATVLPAGAPQILSFTADPPVGCSPANIVLSWQTANTQYVMINNVPAGAMSANGSIGTTITMNTDFTITAWAPNGETTQDTLTVPVDSAPPTVILSPESAFVPVNTSVLVARLGTIALGGNIVEVQNQTGGMFRAYDSTHFIWEVGRRAGTDIYRVYDHNGCGYAYAIFTGQAHF